MKPVVLRKVIIYTRGTVRWMGRFLKKPTRKDVVAAIQCSIDAHVKNLGKKCGDLDYYTSQQREALEIMPHAPADFADDDRVRDMKVAGTILGTIQVLRNTVYVNES